MSLGFDCINLRIAVLKILGKGHVLWHYKVIIFLLLYEDYYIPRKYITDLIQNRIIFSVQANCLAGSRR